MRDVLPAAALITGAAKRVGRHLALHLARQGWDIVVHYNQSSEEAEQLTAQIEGLGRNAVSVQADLTDVGQLHGLFDNLPEAFPPVTTLIHNASLFEKDQLDNFTTESFSAHMQVNLEGPLHLTNAFAGRFPKGEYPGNIICLLDGMKGWSISPVFLSYSLSKMGLANMIELLSTELAPHIRLNGIALGPTIPGVQDKEHTFAKLEWMAPLKRVSNPEEVCNTIDFLLKADGLTGQVIDLSGGMNILKYRKPD
jgi:NAD(P)-dependent dehydrogenase (short-subunit alcohol dehydrogenase family)